MGTNNQDLRVKIPLRFKEQLELRFPDPATIPEGMNVIDLPCPLRRGYWGCKGCPFARWRESDKWRGCPAWIDKVMCGVAWPVGFVENEQLLKWDLRSRTAVLAWLSEFRRRAAELIEWIPDVEAK